MPWRILLNPVRNALQLLRDLREDVAAAPVEPFPKVIFDLPPGAGAAPDGQSSAYINLATALWREAWSRPGNGAPSRTAAALRIIHADVQRAHLLERMLLDKLKVSE